MSVSWFDGVTITVEAALTSATGTYGAWDSGLWDTATWGPDVIWVDISAYVRTIDTYRRFSRDVQAWGSGTATVVLDNRDGRFSPDNLSGPYVTSGVTQVRPLRPLRIRVTYAGTTYYLYSGYAMDWVETTTRDRTGRGDAIVTVPCIDELGRLDGFNPTAQPATGAGDTAGRRIHRILDNAGYTGLRSVEVGQNTMQATTLAANCVTDLKLTTDSEGGGLFVDSDGTIVFEQQYALMENSRSNTVQATFGDGGGSELPCSDIKFSYAGDLIKNIASYAIVGSTAQTATDLTSRALYGDRQDTRTDLVCQTDAQALALATFYIQRFKDPQRRVQQITLKPRRSPTTLFPQVLGRRVRDLVRVVRRPPGGATITRDVHLAGIGHSITKQQGGTWTTTCDLWDASVYQTYSTSRWDVGLWDSAAWFF